MCGARLILCIDKWISVAVRRHFTTRPPLQVTGCEPTYWSAEGRERTQYTTIQYRTIQCITNCNTIHYIPVHNGTVQYNSVALVSHVLGQTWPSPSNVVASSEVIAMVLIFIACVARARFAASIKCVGPRTILCIGSEMPAGRAFYHLADATLPRVHSSTRH